MSFNPYEPPSHSPKLPQADNESRRNDVRVIAVRQKIVLFCILINIFAFGFRVSVNAAGSPRSLQFVLAVTLLVSTLTVLVFSMLLAMKVYNPVVGVFLSLLTIIPILGLLILLLISSRASKILESNGIKVGLFGANLSDLPK